MQASRRMVFERWWVRLWRWCLEHLTRLRQQQEPEEPQGISVSRRLEAPPPPAGRGVGARRLAFRKILGRKKNRGR